LTEPLHLFRPYGYATPTKVAAQEGSVGRRPGSGRLLEGKYVHELSVALGLLEGVEATAARQGIERVAAIHVRVGALSGIAPDALSFSWDLATEDTIAAGSVLRIETVPLSVFCERCEAERAPRAGTGLICPDCGGTCPTIVRGRELQLVAMEVRD
jgi:hydrogenase nickel incorporation protein HypA/HybF